MLWDHWCHYMTQLYTVYISFHEADCVIFLTAYEEATIVCLWVCLRCYAPSFWRFLMALYKFIYHIVFFCCFSFVCRYCFRHCWLIVKQGIRSGKTAPAAFTDFSGDRQTSEDNLPSTNLPSHPRKWLLKCVNVWLCLSFIHEAIFTYYVSNGTLKSLSLSQSVMQNMFSLQNFPPIIHSSSNSWKTCFGWSIGTVLY